MRRVLFFFPPQRGGDFITFVYIVRVSSGM